MYKKQRVIFEPIKYIKAEVSYIVAPILTKKKTPFKLASVNFAMFFTIIKVLWHVGLPFVFLMSGLIILTTQIVIPNLSGKVSKDFIKPLATDVMAYDNKSEVLTGSEDFEFADIVFNGLGVKDYAKN